MYSSEKRKINFSKYPRNVYIFIFLEKKNFFLLPHINRGKYGGIFKFRYTRKA